MKKFYKIAEAGPAPGGFVVRLDGKPVKTPLGHALLLPSQALAAAIALEWAGQEADIKPDTMPLTRLANTMVDKARGADRAGMNAELIKYAGSDLICYFATHPADLVRRHEQQWRPLHVWLKERHDISFHTVSGIKYQQQPQEALDKMKKLITGLEAGDFTVVQAAAATIGSVAIALALLEEHLSADEAYHASCVDEIYQLETWGADEISQQRLEVLKSELASIVTFNELLKASS